MMMVWMMALGTQAQAADTRPRAGFALGAIRHDPGPAYGGVLQAQLGLQGDGVGLLVDGTLDLGVGLSQGYEREGQVTQVSAVGMTTLSPLLEANVDAFGIAVGPVVGFGGWTTARRVNTFAATEDVAYTVEGIQPGAQLRLSQCFGEERASGRRQGVTATANIRVLNGRVTEVYANDNRPGLVPGARRWSATLQVLVGYSWR